ncbi:MAG: DUF2202 domain-containing protein [Sulfurovum sp.]|uniref:DUF2202 domain-containing protein n=1 Tax=Sulfurovum sp. TaxID=1969726 RepID=UPI003C737BD3
MKNDLRKGLIVGGSVLFIAAFSIIGCSSDTVSEIIEDANLSEIIDDAINAPESTLTQELKDSIAYMYSEESLAYDVYTNIYKLQPIDELEQIAVGSEAEHIDAVNRLAIKYDLNMTQYPDTDVSYSIEGIGDGHYPIEHIQELYELLYDKGIQSPQDALEVGCMVEVVDIVDLNEFIEMADEADASDVLQVFTSLRDGSYNHYWAFDTGLKDMGISEGCCVLEPALGFDFCQPDYPQK